MSEPRKLVTLGMFIIDEFSFLDAAGKPTAGHTLSPQERAHLPICSRSPAYILRFSPLQIGGGTYTNIGARIW